MLICVDKKGYICYKLWLMIFMNDNVMAYILNVKVKKVCYLVVFFPVTYVSMYSLWQILKHWC